MTARLRRLLKRRQRAAQAAPPLEEVLRGTLRERFVRCGKAGCHCQKAPGHGPVGYLSVSLGTQRTLQFSIGPENYPVARRWTANYTRLWRALETVSAINRELLRRRLMLKGGAGADSVRRQRRRRR